MKMSRLRPLVAAQLLLSGPFECWRLARARRALQRLGAADHRPRLSLGEAAMGKPPVR